MHAYGDIPTDVEAMIRKFCAKVFWVPPRFQICVQLNVSLAVVDHNHNWLFLFSVESWHLPINLSAQIAPDYISEYRYLNFQNFPGRQVPRTP